MTHTFSSESAKRDDEEASGTSTPAIDGVSEGAGPAIEASAYDKEGLGEENEETTYEIRCKVYRLMKKEEGGHEWKDMGVGTLTMRFPS